MPEHLTSCHCCGLIQIIPPMSADQIAVCDRCYTKLKHNSNQRNRLTIALSLAALAFYLPAILLPMLHIQRLGHVSEGSLLDGISTLWAQGYWHIGLLIFLFSVILPPAKLLALLALSSTQMVTRHHHKAAIYHLVEFMGRWGMLDVLLVAILVAFVKLGDLVDIQAGRGVIAFAVLVLLSLLASLSFNPTLMWQDPETEQLPT